MHLNRQNCGTYKNPLTLQSLRFSIFIQTLLSASELPCPTKPWFCVAKAHRIGNFSSKKSLSGFTVGGETLPASKEKTQHKVLLKKYQNLFFAKSGCTQKCASRKSIKNYLITLITTPEPTVLPPSRIAKRRPFSIAIGAMSSTFMSTLSPGLHISTPSGRVMIPVTSVVLKQN